MLELIHNSINSEYIIINFKLEFNELDSIEYKKVYYNIILEWIKLILNNYKIVLNWTFYINNLNYNTIRIFLLIDKYNYPNMDDGNIIYITNAFEFYNKNDINILDLSKLFNINELKVIIEQEFNNIKNNLNSTKSNCSSLSSDSSLIQMSIDNIIEDHFDEINKFNESNESNETNETNETNEINKPNETNEINKPNEIKNINLPETHNIKAIGLSGVNKNTFIHELKKINILKHSDIYYNKKHNIFNNQIYKKIKENNKYFWILYDDYLDELNYSDSIYGGGSSHSKDTNIFYDSNLNYKLNTILSIINNKNLKYKNTNKYFNCD